MAEGAALAEGPLTLPLTAAEPAPIGLVGGKAAALLRLRQAGFEVPDGVVLTTAFFSPWSEAVQQSEAWRRALASLRGSERGAAGGELAKACKAAQVAAGRLPLDEERRAALVAIAEGGSQRSFAVRSSSPEEDLEAASFAGLYETVLGVAPEALEAAVRQCFASALGERVLRYQRERGQEDVRPRIAVIVQRQVASEVAGVAFSVNPLTNDYDEMLINASWGLGEALVDGDLTPDSFVANKMTGALESRQIGDKGGERPDEACLSAQDIADVLDNVKRIEALFGDPVDVEWAFAEGRLHLLQARPITAWVPLHESLITPPGAPRRLYVDGYLTDAITMSTAITPMSEDVNGHLYRLLFGWLFPAPPDASALAHWGMHSMKCRLYLDVSMYLHWMSSDAMIEASKIKNPLIGELLASPEIERYRAANPLPHVRGWHLLRHLPRILWHMRGALLPLLGPLRNPQGFHDQYRRAIADFDSWINQPLDHSASIAQCIDESLLRAGQAIAASSLPAFMRFFYLQQRIRSLANADDAQQVAWANAISNTSEDDMIVKMGAMLYDMAALLPAAAFEDIEALEGKLLRRDLPEAFLRQWDDFARRYGCRGPLEMEIANPKYGDAPRLALRQMASLAGPDATSPHDLARRQARLREEAYAGLLAALPPRKARRLKKHYAASIKYAASREMFKHHIMQVFGRVRALLLHRADALVRDGRLDEPAQIFQMTLEDLEIAAADAAFDARACVAERGAHYRKLKACVRHFPMFIDSRGRIMRVPPALVDGALSGTPVSPGIVQGPVKVLNDPFEKDVLPGDVLVAVTTDPGWTPLFINAAAVVLEHGGELQHGALVAREYGKPCVTGIQDVTDHFRDGQRVEVDGSAGTVRVVDSSAEALGARSGM